MDAEPDDSNAGGDIAGDAIEVAPVYADGRVALVLS